MAVRWPTWLSWAYVGRRGPTLAVRWPTVACLTLAVVACRGSTLAVRWPTLAVVGLRWASWAVVGLRWPSWAYVGCLLAYGGRAGLRWPFGSGFVVVESSGGNVSSV